MLFEQECSTLPMLVVKYRLKINENIPEKWYKDEGGQVKTIPLDVSIDIF